MKNLTTTFLQLIICFSMLVLLSCHHTPQPYTVYENREVILSYLVKDNKIYYERTMGAALLGVNPKMKVFCTLTNTSDYSGVFKLKATLMSQGNSLVFEKEQFIASGATALLSEEKEINPYTFETNVSVSWNIEAPKKTLTEPVTRYK